MHIAKREYAHVYNCPISAFSRVVTVLAAYSMLCNCQTLFSVENWERILGEWRASFACVVAVCRSVSMCERCEVTVQLRTSLTSMGWNRKRVATHELMAPEFERHRCRRIHHTHSKLYNLHSIWEFVKNSFGVLYCQIETSQAGYLKKYGSFIYSKSNSWCIKNQKQIDAKMNVFRSRESKQYLIWVNMQFISTNSIPCTAQHINMRFVSIWCNFWISLIWHTKFYEYRKSIYFDCCWCRMLRFYFCCSSNRLKLILKYFDR